MQTLVLDASFQPVNMISGLDALVKIITGKAEAVANYKEVVRSASLSFQLPRIIRLNRIVREINHNTQIAYSKRNVTIRDNNTCQYCAKKLTTKTATIDHVMPKSRGGKNTWENTVVACYKCNNKKDCKTPDEAKMKLLKQPRAPKLLEDLREELRKAMTTDWSCID